MKKFAETSIVALLLGALSVPSGAAARALSWVPYQSAALKFQLKVPATWKLFETEQAVAFKGPGKSAQRPAIGILRSRQKGLTIEQAADKEFEQAGHPVNWTRSHAYFAGWRALKVVGTSQKSLRLVEYYVEAPEGYYLVQCIGPKNQWASFSRVFTRIIDSFQFLE